VRFLLDHSLKQFCRTRQFADYEAGAGRLVRLPPERKPDRHRRRYGAFLRLLSSSAFFARVD